MQRAWRRLLLQNSLRILFLLGLVVAFLLSHPSCPWLSNSAIAQDKSPAQLVQDGVDAYQQGDYSTAIATWNQALEAYPPEAPAERALINQNLARAYHQIGFSPEAINSWEAAAAIYRQGGDTSQVGRMLTEQAQVYLSMGQYRRAIALLCLPKSDTDPADCESGTALPIATATNDSLGKVAALGSLGEAYRLRGDYDAAKTFLQQGLDLAKEANHLQFEIPMLNSLGSIYRRQAQVEKRRGDDLIRIAPDNIQAREFFTSAQNYDTQALQNLNNALSLAQRQNDLRAELQTQLNLLQIYRRQENQRAVADSQQRIAELLEQLPPNREIAYGAITLAKSYQPFNSTFQCVVEGSETQARVWLETGVTIAEQIADQRAKSFALGELGHLYECQGDLTTAMALTQRAQQAATEGLASADSLYLWQWQEGRINRQQGRSDKALAAYEQAVATLETIRTEILVADQDVQFDFRDTVEPIYRELIELQLASVTANNFSANKQLPIQPFGNNSNPIEAALLTADSLRLAELQNYFGNDCILEPVAQARVDLLAQSTNTAMISSVILKERTALIANLPDQPPQLFWIDDSQQLQETVNQFRLGLEAFYVEDDDGTTMAIANQLYELLMQPFEPALEAANINTLVFIHDGFLRRIPMAALHDGKQFLIEKYAVATTPALTLTAPETQRPDPLRALALGSSQAVEVGTEIFRPLPAVTNEVSAVQSALPESKVFLDEDFSKIQLEQALETGSYPILHFATHGRFSPDPEENFIVTGQGEKVTFGQLESFIRATTPGDQKIDLVVLTACETAAGDDRATLGLAGVAIRAGARSAIATLWLVDDQTTSEISQYFYEFLQDPNLNKAQALQQAQIKVLSGSSSVTPGKWAPLILVGNWV